MNKYGNKTLIGATLLATLMMTGALTSCSGGAQEDAKSTGTEAEKPAGKDDGHDDHAADAKPGSAEAHSEGDGDGEHGEEESEEGVVKLTPDQIKASGIGVVAVGRGGGASTRLAGRVEPAIGGRAAIASTVTGRVERVLVAPGTAVKSNQPLVIIVSGEAATFKAAATAAAAEAEAIRLAYGRDKSLVEQGVVARQELEASRARSLAADAAASAARAQVAASGSPDSSGRVTISSPVAGVVGNVQVTPGGVVSAGTLVAEVSNPDMNELVFTAPPALATLAVPGMKLEVTGPGGSFEAEVIAAAANVMQQGGTATIRAKPISEKLPPAGSPVSAVIIADGAAGGMSVPADAVQSVDGRSVVFVAVQGGFQATPVLAGRRAGNRIEILNGLTGSERLVGANAFLLKAELAKGEAEHGH